MKNNKVIIALSLGIGTCSVLYWESTRTAVPGRPGFAPTTPLEILPAAALPPLELTPEALLGLGYDYLHGNEEEGVAQDVYHARTIFEQLATQTTDPAIALEATRAIGAIYRDGLGVTRDRNKAREYYLRVANQQNDFEEAVAALMQLGDMYFFVDPDFQNFDEARTFYTRAIDVATAHNIPEDASGAHYNLGDIYCYHQENTPEAYAQAREHYQQAADQNENLFYKANAQFQLGRIYFYGYGIPTVDYNRARELFQAAIENPEETDLNNSERAQAELWLGEIYYHGYGGIPIDYARALTYFNDAVQHGAEMAQWVVASAQWYLGQMYYLGHGVPHDNARAHQYFEQVVASPSALDIDKERAQVYLNQMINQ